MAADSNRPIQDVILDFTLAELAKEGVPARVRQGDDGYDGTTGRPGLLIPSRCR
ncbi:MAG: hypothetical protein LBR21_07015 [Propionibacteriaceae bacterium]|jgi:hypothetical protein|nr:hypothetical protein [Propionibacteriaceae bacterium]